MRRWIVPFTSYMFLLVSSENVPPRQTEMMTFNMMSFCSDEQKNVGNTTAPACVKSQRIGRKIMMDGTLEGWRMRFPLSRTLVGVVLRFLLFKLKVLHQCISHHRAARRSVSVHVMGSSLCPNLVVSFETSFQRISRYSPASVWVYYFENE